MLTITFNNLNQAALLLYNIRCGSPVGFAGSHSVMQYATKYVNLNSEMDDADVLDTPLLPIEVTMKPDIILSETFLM